MCELSWRICRNVLPPKCLKSEVAKQEMASLLECLPLLEKKKGHGVV